MNDDFDFSDVQNQTTKKNYTKPIKKNKSKNNQNDDFFDMLDDQKPKITQKKPSQSNKQNSFQLPPIGVNKPQKSELKSDKKNKMDLSLEELNTQKKSYLPKQKLSPKKQSEQFDFAVYGEQNTSNIKPNKPEKQNPTFKRNNSSLKVNVDEKKQYNQKTIPNPKQQIHKPLPSPKINTKIVKKQPEKDQQQYEEEYQQLVQEEITPKAQIKRQPASQILHKNIEKLSPKVSHTKQANKQIKQIKKEVKQIKEEKKQVKKEVKQVKKQNQTVKKNTVQQKQQRINKFKQMVQKSFPGDQTEDQVKKMKPDSVNRLNDKMREMIKGFSAQLTALIDKNLTLLRRPQNQIKQQIDGEPLDPLEAQIKVLEQNKRNNEKILQNYQKQLETLTKMCEKISTSGQNTIRLAEQIEAHKKHIGITSRQISNLKNDVQKQGNKVVKLEQGNTNSRADNSKSNNGIQAREKLTNTKLQHDKNKRKIQQLNQKISSLQQKISDISYKKTEILQKASSQGISLYSKEDQKKYLDLKKKREQLQLFDSKFKSSIKSKQTLIQHQITDLQTLGYDYEQKIEVLNQDAEQSKLKILSQIKKAKANPKIGSNTKQVLSQLQIFMNQDNQNATEERINSLTYITENIFKKEKRANPKTVTEQKQIRKIAYKNYIQSVAKINEQNKQKFSSQRRNSQQNPFRKALTPAASNQGKSTANQKDNLVEGQKQKQRVWKSSNTQNLIRNPLRNQNLHRYEKEIELQNPLNNKEIIKLIDKNKQKIILKEQISILKDQANKSQQSALNKKPFSFRSSVKQKSLDLDEIKNIPHDMNNIQKTMELKQSSSIHQKQISQIDRINKINEMVQIKLKQKQTFPIVKQEILQNKPALNVSPFRNIKLKKDKQNQNQNSQSDLGFKIQIPKQIPQKSNHMVQKSNYVIQKSSHVVQSINPVVQNTPKQQQASFKPKRFAVRKRNQNAQQGYMPTAVVQKIQQTPKDFIIVPKKKQQSQKLIQISQKKIQQKIIPFPQTKKTKPIQEPYDPFKKLMNSQKEEISIKVDKQQKSAALKLDNQVNINAKPKLNLFKKAVEQPEKKLIVLNDTKKQTVVPVQQQKFINPYSNKLQTDSIPIQREGRVKKLNIGGDGANKIVSNKNIYDNVDDMTTNNILSLGQPQKKIQSVNQNQYVPPKIQQKQKQPNLNDLLGIKKKNNQIDKDLLLDLNIGENKHVAKRNVGKKNDFFGDLDL